MAASEIGGLSMGPEFTFLTQVTDVRLTDEGRLAAADGYFQVPSLSELDDPDHPLRYLSAHFPGNVLMPGNLESEALAQLLGHAVVNDPVNAENIVMLYGDAGRSFNRPVRPGEQLDLNVEIDLTNRKKTRVIALGTAQVGGELACRVTGLTLAVIPASRAGQA